MVEFVELFYDVGFYVWEWDIIVYDGVGFFIFVLKILDNLGVDCYVKLRVDIYSIMGEFYSGRGVMWCVESVVEYIEVLVIC